MKQSNRASYYATTGGEFSKAKKDSSSLPGSFESMIGGHEFKVVRFNDAPPVDVTLNNTVEVAAYLAQKLEESVMFRPDVENLIVIHLNTRLKPIGFEVICNGTLNHLLVDPRQIFKSAVLANSAFIVLAHNHPSGDPSPSEADIKATRDLIQACKIMKIELLDHIILGNAAKTTNDYASLRGLGYFNAN